MAIEKKAAIKDIVANADVVDKLTKSKTLIEKYTRLVALGRNEQLKTEEYTFCRRFLTMQLLYR